LAKRGVGGVNPTLHREWVPSHEEVIAALMARLRDMASDERAGTDKAYHKSRWAHWGVSAPHMDIAIRETVKDIPARTLLKMSAELGREPVWDLKIAAGRILARPAVPATDALWRFVSTRMADLDGWAVADNLAPVAAKCLLADPRRLDAVEKWVSSRHLWTRRAALVFTLPWTKEGRDPERMLGWASDLAPDPEWFIQKAVGWWLRELSKRNPARVRRFLRDHPTLKGVALREASKYL
jgi:3-methyladenine DNA glycosylase AlkD